MALAQSIARSGIIPRHLINKPSDVLVLLMKGRELGIPPMQAIDGINVIQGKPTVSPQLMLALIYKHCPSAKVDVKASEESQTVTCTMSNNGSSHSVTWNKSKAQSMQLLQKDNWKKQFMNMLKWRAVAECARVVFPHIIMGLYTTEEMDSKDDYNYDDEGNASPRRIVFGDKNKVHNKVKELWPSYKSENVIKLYSDVIEFNPKREYTEDDIEKFCTDLENVKKAEIKEQQQRPQQQQTIANIGPNEIPF